MESTDDGLDGKKQPGRVVDKPTNPMVTPLLNDLYQFTMAYAYWKAGKQSERSVLVSLNFDCLKIHQNLK